MVPPRAAAAAAAKRGGSSGAAPSTAAAGGGGGALAVLLAASALLRALLVLWGVLQDAYARVPYTDIDYSVFTDAAALVADGRSPYGRATYRYTPLIAYLLVPNVWLTPLWGKLLFSAADILVGWQLWRLATLQRAPPRAALAAAALWLANPFTFAISTRGSCDALAAAALVGALLLLIQGRELAAALLYGLAVHARIYPIIYAPSAVLFLARRRLALAGSSSSSSSDGRRANSRVGASSGALAFAAAAAREALVFGGASGGAFFALGAAFYAAYGAEFLREAFLHHLSRRDPRHCFSAHWYHVYLTYGGGGGTSDGGVGGGAGGSGAAAAAATAAAARWLDPERVAPLTQLSALLALAAALHARLPLCWLASTVAFVALNKVSTAQYFVWWLALLPAALPALGWPPKRGVAAALAGWAAAQVHWLYWGYQLEFEGARAHLALWAASVVFLGANAWLAVALIRAGAGAGAAGQGGAPATFLDASVALARRRPRGAGGGGKVAREFDGSSDEDGQHER